MACPVDAKARSYTHLHKDSQSMTSPSICILCKDSAALTRPMEWHSYHCPHFTDEKPRVTPLRSLSKVTQLMSHRVDTGPRCVS